MLLSCHPVLHTLREPLALPPVHTPNPLLILTGVHAYRYDVPLVADIHFQPVVASMVAECFEKIRVNPGNFVDGRKKFDEKVYDDDSQFKQEQDHIIEVPSCARPFAPHANNATPATSFTKPVRDANHGDVEGALCSL